MDTAQWAQGIGVVKVAQPPQPHMEVSNNPKIGGGAAVPSSMIERRAARPAKEQALNCPRCNSTNTKFCYYNNYSLSQPRYFCKACRRYWTEGGSLRNVPVGGGSRKNKRSAPPPSTATTTPPPPSTKKLNIPELIPQSCSVNFPHSASQNPKIQHGQDLNLSYPPPNQDISKFIELPFSANARDDDKAHRNHGSSAMELLKTGISAASSRGLGSFMPVPLGDSGGAMYGGSAGFPMQDFKPGLNFGLEGFENGYGGFHGEGNSGARMLFPVEDLKQHQQVQSSNDRSEGDSTPHHGYWNGMLGGGPGGGSW